MSLSLLSCWLETLIPLAPSLGAGCSLLVPLGNESSLISVRGRRITHLSDFRLDPRHRPINQRRFGKSG